VAELPEDGELLGAARDDVNELIAETDGLEGAALDILVTAARARFGDERVEGISA
jgi:hypothetical protein